MNSTASYPARRKLASVQRAFLGCSLGALVFCSVAPAGRSDEAPPAAGVFQDATARSGIDFEHDNGRSGRYLLPEVAGSGVALFDYDNDGDLDLYLVQGAPLDDSPDSRASDRLFRNDGTAQKPAAGPQFTDVTEKSGIRAFGYGMGAAVGDFNGDGWEDLYVTNLGPNQLWRNNGDGSFTDVASEAGVQDPRWNASASFCDYDRDGRLDLFVTAYVNFASDMDVVCYAANSAVDYCGPDSYQPLSDRLFRNRDGRVFDDMSARTGVAALAGSGLGVVCADLNNDAWLDFYVANDGDPNFFWGSRGDGRFEEEALLAGLALNDSGRAEAGMGVDAADLDNDGDEELFLSHLEQESNTLYVNEGGGLFSDRTIAAGLHASSLAYTGFGTRFADFDNDGWLDLFVANGAVRIDFGLLRRGDPYPLGQANQLFRQIEPLRFADWTGGGAALARIAVSRGLAAGDLDNDGDTDLVISNSRGRPQLLLNQTGSGQSWIGFDLREGPRRATGAAVSLTLPGGRRLRRRARVDGSYLSSSDPRILFGLGRAERIETLRVEWSDGAAVELEPLPTRRYWLIRRGAEPLPAASTAP